MIQLIIGIVTAVVIAILQIWKESTGENKSLGSRIQISVIVIGTLSMISVSALNILDKNKESPTDRKLQALQKSFDRLTAQLEALQPADPQRREAEMTGAEVVKAIETLKADPLSFLLLN